MNISLESYPRNTNSTQGSSVQLRLILDEVRGNPSISHHDICHFHKSTIVSFFFLIHFSMKHLSVFGSSVPPRSYVRRAWDMPTDRGTMWLLMDVTAGAD